MEILRKVGSGISFVKGRPVLDIHCRTAHNDRKTVKVFNLPCYFYTKEDEYIEEEDRKGTLLGEFPGFYSLYGQPLKKVIVKKIRDIKRLGKLYHGYESDLKWDKKCLLDLKITDMFVYDNEHAYTLDERFNAMNPQDIILTAPGGLTSSGTIFNENEMDIVTDALKLKESLLLLSPDKGSAPYEVRYAVIDIEVIVDKREDLRNYDGEIVCAVIYDSYTKEYKKIMNDKSERKLISDILKHFAKLDVDIIFGWNVDFYM